MVIIGKTKEKKVTAPVAEPQAEVKASKTKPAKAEK